MSRHRSQQGMTLMELMVVIGIVAILSGIAALSISAYQRRTLLKETTRSIEGDFAEIRGAARTRQQPVLVAITSPTTYTACIDIDANMACTGADTLILTRTFTGGVQLIAPAIFPATFTYSNLGTINAATQIIASLPTEPNRRYCVSIFPTGVTRVEWNESGALPPCGVVPWARAW